MRDIMKPLGAASMALPADAAKRTIGAASWKEADLVPANFITSLLFWSLTSLNNYNLSNGFVVFIDVILGM